jgi:hypothetical protein
MVSRAVLILMILALPTAACHYLDFGEEPVCQVCRRLMHKATFYRVFLQGQDPVDVCCPRCGLYFQQSRSDVVRSEVADFVTGTLLEASRAFYVENSSVHLCCSQDFVQKDASGQEYVLAWDRCLPSLIAFRDRDRAEEFTRKNGGMITTYDQLLKETLR